MAKIIDEITVKGIKYSIQDSSTKKRTDRIETLIAQIDGSIWHIDGSIRDIDSSIQRIDGNIRRIDSTLQSIDSSIQRIDSNIQRIDSCIGNIMTEEEYKALPEKKNVFYFCYEND